MQSDDNQSTGSNTGGQQNKPIPNNLGKQDPILPAANQQIAQNLPEPTAADTPRLSVEPPREAGDNDVIEKEWVEKAKHIVDQTKDNPHQQQEELAKMKKQYLKKRYNRDGNTPG